MCYMSSPVHMMRYIIMAMLSLTASNIENLCQTFMVKFTALHTVEYTENTINITEVHFTCAKCPKRLYIN